VSDEFGDLMGVYTCPSDVQTACSEAPQGTTVDNTPNVAIDNVAWPSFTSIEPTQAKVDHQVTVKGLNFGSNPTVLFGNYHGCVSSSIVVSGDSITCTIGARSFVPVYRDSVEVDVIIQYVISCQIIFTSY
jgi:hypothetical protein